MWPILFQQKKRRFIQLKRAARILSIPGERGARFARIYNNDPQSQRGRGRRRRRRRRHCANGDFVGFAPILMRAVACVKGIAAADDDDGIALGCEFRGNRAKVDR